MGFLSFLKITKEPGYSGETTSGQLRFTIDHPFSKFYSSYSPLRFNQQLYSVMRESIPYLDIAILKYVRLIGMVKVVSEDENLAKELNAFFENVKVNFFSKGIESYITQVVDTTLQSGMSISELVLNSNFSDIDSLRIGPSDSIRFLKNENSNTLLLGQEDPTNGIVASFPFQELIYYTAFDQRNGHPEGYSMFYSLPFASRVFLRIQHAIENQIWRVGDPTFFTKVKAGGAKNFADIIKAKNDVRQQMENNFKDRRQGYVRDIYAAIPGDSDIDISILGDGDTLQVEIPTRIVQEQIISRTGLPPHIFGLYKWTTTERLSTHQTDFLISDINSYRRKLNVNLQRMLSMYMAIHSLKGEFHLEWEAVNLMDEESQAKTRMYTATATAKEIDSYIKLYELGLLNPDTFYDIVFQYVDQNKKGFNSKKDFLIKVSEKLDAEKAAIISNMILNDRSNGNIQKAFNHKGIDSTVID